jgi:hypothetical protein
MLCERYKEHYKSDRAGPGLKCPLAHEVPLENSKGKKISKGKSVEYRYASHTTIASPEAYLALYESDYTYHQMAQDVINLLQVEQYKLSVNRIPHFISQMTLESGTIFTVRPSLYCFFRTVNIPS